MRPRLVNGRNRAERAPTTTRASPLAAARQARARSGAERRGVPFDRGAAEAALEAVHELAGEGDLGQHDQHLPALRHGSRHRLEVDLGLAGAGDPVEQRHREAALGGRAKRVGGGLLRVAELDLGVGRVGNREAPLGNRYLDQHARPDEAVDDARGALGLGGQRGLGADLPVGGGLDGALAGGRHAGRLRGAGIELHPEPGLGGLEHRGRPHHHTHHHPQGRQSVAGHPLGEPEREDGEGRDLGQSRDDGLELAVRHRLARIAEGSVPDHAEASLRAEGNQDEGAGGGCARVCSGVCEVLGQRVVVGLVECDRQQNGHPWPAARGDRTTVIELCEQAFQSWILRLEARPEGSLAAENWR